MSKQEKIDAAVEKCMVIFSKKTQAGKGGARKAADKALERIFKNDLGTFLLVSEEILVPKMKAAHFSGMTLQDFLKIGIEIYASKQSLDAVWDWLDNDIPLSIDEYSALADLLTSEINKLPNPPTQLDWDLLEESLMK